MRANESFTPVEQLTSDVGSAALCETNQTRQIFHQRTGAQSLNAVAPERDIAPRTTPSAMRQDLHLAMLVEHQGTMQRTDRRILGVLQRWTRERPMLHSGLPGREAIAWNLLELEDLPHDNNGGGKRGDPGLFSGRELGRIARDLVAARNEIR